MFCSNCGKSLRPDDKTCPFCGMSVGESRFESNRGYTGAQTVMRPGQAVRVPDSYGSHYSTDFAVDSDAHELPSDEETSYRAVRGAGIRGYGEDDKREPLYNSEESEAAREAEQAREEEDFDPPEAEAEAEKPRRRSLRELLLRKEEEPAPQEEPPSPVQDGDEELSEEELEAIGANVDEDEQPDGGAGISEGVRRVMSQLREEYDRKEREQRQKEERKAARRRAYEEEGEALPEDEGAKPEPEEPEKEAQPKKREKLNLEKPKKQKPAKAAKKAKDEVSEEDEEDETPSKPARSLKTLIPHRDKKRSRRFEEDFDDLDLDEEAADESAEFDEMDEEFSDESFDREERRTQRLKILRYVLAALSLVLVIFLVIWGIGRIGDSTKTAPVEEVSLELWNEGIELMQQRVGSSYRRRMLGMYDTSKPESFVDLSAAMTQDLDTLSNLMPTEPQRNDSRFINALKAIQESINNCLTNDALALTDTSRSGSEKDRASEERWQMVRDLVTQLSRSTNTGMLDAIIKHDKVELIAQATPEPDPTPTPQPYQTLARGANGTAVMRLQTRLTELGYMTSAIDGDYGSKTKTAVEKFQQTAGIEVTGIADPDTQQRLFADDAPYLTK